MCCCWVRPSSSSWLEACCSWPTTALEHTCWCASAFVTPLLLVAPPCHSPDMLDTYQHCWLTVEGVAVSMTSGDAQLLFTASVTPVIHNWWDIKDQNAQLVELIMFFKVAPSAVHHHPTLVPLCCLR